MYSLDSIFEPEINSVIHEIKSYLDFSKICYSEKLISSLFSALAEKINKFSRNILVAEIDRFKKLGLYIEYVDKERFEMFIKEICKDDNKQKMLLKYPVLRENLEKITRGFCDFILEVLDCLKKDMQLINEKIFKCSPGELREIILLGDMHNSNSATSLIIFSDSTNSLFKCLYKPRNAKLEFILAKVYGWISKRINITFWVQNQIDRGSYSWHEFLGNSNCSTESIIEDFYERLGAQLAVCYILNGKDIHYENIIAHQGFPVIIDYECFFSSSVDNISVQANRMLTDNLILRNDIIYGEQYEHLDISAISGRAGQKFLTKSFNIINNFTVNIGIEAMSDITKIGNNIPKLNNVLVNPSLYSSFFISGFKDCYNIIMQNKKSFLALIKKIPDAEVRVSLRSTPVYDQIINNFCRSDICLSEEIQRDYISKQLIKTSMNSPNSNVFILADEVNDLVNLNIPYFYTRVNSTAIYNSKKESIQLCCYNNCTDEIIKNVNNLNSKDLFTQIQVIKNSFDQLAFYENMPLSSFKEHHENLTLNEHIRKCLNTICDLTIETNNSINWPTISHCMLKNKELVLNSFTKHDFYDGLPGIALLFSHASQMFEQKYKQYSLKINRNLINYISTANDFTSGFYCGSGALIYSIVKLFKSTPYIDAESIINEILSKMRIGAKGKGSIIDLIDGTSGLLLGLLHAFSEFPYNVKIQHGIEKCLDKLLSINFQQLNFNKNLTFSHGCAGYLYTLARTYKLLGGTSVFKQLNITKKYLDINLKPDDEVAWCRGYSSYIIAQYEYNQAVSNDILLLETCYLEKCLLQASNMKNLSLCHGVAGVLDFLISAKINYGAINDEQYSYFSKKLTNIILSKQDCSYERGSIGLMTGLSGIVYQLLRYQQPSLLPSLLYL